jgi:hypothetical protein
MAATTAHEMLKEHMDDCKQKLQPDAASHQALDATTAANNSCKHRGKHSNWHVLRTTATPAAEHSGNWSCSQT